MHDKIQIITQLLRCNMKRLLILILFISGVAISGDPSKKPEVKDPSNEPELNHSMWIEPNYVDTEYSVLLRNIKLEKIDMSHDIYDHIPFGWIPYQVVAQIEDVYKGEINKNESLDLLVYVSALGVKNTVKKISGKYLLSFCKSKGGIYYTSRDYLIQNPSIDNVKKFELVRDNGTDYEGSGDCSGNYPSLNPDTHN